MLCGRISDRNFAVANSVTIEVAVDNAPGVKSWNIEVASKRAAIIAKELFKTLGSISFKVQWIFLSPNGSQNFTKTSNHSQQMAKFDINTTYLV